MPLFFPSEDFYSATKRGREMLAIDHATQRVVKQIDRSTKRYDTSDKPLFLIIGEDHSIANHQLFQAYLTLALQDKGYRLRFGTENAHSLMFQHMREILQEGYDHDLSEDEYETHFAAEIEALHSICFEHVFDKPEARHASNVLCRLIDSLNLTMDFNDAARDKIKSTHIDLTDKKTAEIAARALTAEGTTDIDRSKLTDDMHMYVRNTFIAQRLLEIQHNHGHEVDIYIQVVGRAHIAGIKDEYSAENSLSGLLADEDINVIYIPLYDRENGMDERPDNHNLSRDRDIADIIVPGEEFIDWSQKPEQTSITEDTTAPINHSLINNSQDIDQRERSHLRYAIPMLGLHESLLSDGADMFRSRFSRAMMIGLLSLNQPANITFNDRATSDRNVSFKP